MSLLFLAVLPDLVLWSWRAPSAPVVSGARGVKFCRGDPRLLYQTAFPSLLGSLWSRHRGCLIQETGTFIERHDAIR